jgi:hypothetical protein
VAVFQTEISFLRIEKNRAHHFALCNAPIPLRSGDSLLTSGNNKEKRQLMLVEL